MSSETESSVSNDFGAIRWRMTVCLLVLGLYLASWLAADHYWRSWFAPLRDAFADLDDLVFWEYASLAISCLIKLLGALAVVLVIRGSGTSAAAIGLGPGWRWTGAGLLLGWLVLILAGSHLSWTFAGPQASSRPGQPPLEGMLIMTTLALRGVVNPLAEELIFRVLAYLSLRSLLGAGLALPLAALVFGLWHYGGGMPQVAVAAVLGAVLIMLYERSQSLPRTYLAHSCFNLGRLLLALDQGHL